MNVLIFKTDITSKEEVDQVQQKIIDHPAITKLTVDTEDIDKVLRIELGGLLSEIEIIALVQQLGHKCEVLEN
ncbi:hypothetical protein [Crocinitomix catalasitica]|uniref:hypothetical protein n=1 Tax=Crocinitomix catalasitica TaxID=184607 RepID=UPI00048684F9|nr:hypothetical protein [Crocinitomix catalasitica]